MHNPIKDHWNNDSDRYFKSFEDIKSYEAVKKNPEIALPIAVYPIIKKYVGDLRGKKVLVPSSGDNVGAFGLHLLGAKVTSCDIAEKQIENAQKIARQNGWDIEFLVQDTMSLEKIRDDEYDLVYTSNGVHVWINDMPAMYKNIYRVIKNGGYNIFFETHPVGRPFDMSTYQIKVRKHYADVYIDANDEVPTYEWRTQDFVNAVLSSGLVLREMAELHSKREDLFNHNYLRILPNDTDSYNWPGDTFDWKNNPWAALPQCLCLCSQKLTLHGSD